MFASHIENHGFPMAMALLTLVPALVAGVYYQAKPEILMIWCWWARTGDLSTNSTIQKPVASSNASQFYHVSPIFANGNVVFTQS